MLKILNRITSGKGEEGDISLLEEICDVVQVASLCALGQSAVNPVKSTIKYFREEFEVHIREKRCPAGVCKELVSFEIDPIKCKGCGLCAKDCPVEAIVKTPNKVHEIDNGKCIKCGACFSVCPDKFGAVRKVAAMALQGVA